LALPGGTSKPASLRWSLYRLPVIARVEAEGREQSTITQNRRHALLHIVPRIGQVRLAKVTPPNVAKFRDGLLANMSRATARKVLTSFKSLLKAANHAHIADNVSIGHDKRGKCKLEIGRDIPATAEVKRMIDAATDQKRKALLLTAALTELCASELRGRAMGRR
jgi:integrase